MTPSGIKDRFQTAVMQYPLGWLNTQTTRPLAALCVALRMTPNQVTVLSVLLSGAGIALVAWGDWRLVLGGAGLIHLGLLLDHADGQVARRRGMGSTWGMYLDWSLDRVVEVGCIVAMGVASLRGVPHPVLDEWRFAGPQGLLVLTATALGAVLAWRGFMVYNDLLLLRGHLLGAQALPSRQTQPHGPSRRPLVPWLLTRDWLFLFIVAGVALNQFQGALLVILAAFALGSLEKFILFRIKHRQPEGDAARVLWSDFH